MEDKKMAVKVILVPDGKGGQVEEGVVGNMEL